MKHWQAGKRVLRYLKGTTTYGLVYRQGKDLFNAYVDSDWGTDADERRSISGYVLLYGSSVISWARTTQKTVALSSTEAEYMSAAVGAREAAWFSNLLEELEWEHKKPMTLYCDNQGAIFLGNNACIPPPFQTYRSAISLSKRKSVEQ